MPIFDRPALLGVGLLLALVPPLLHLITRRARESRPLPTARFLDPHARAKPWLQRRPSDLPLLLLRSLFLLLLGLAAAGPIWPGRAGGTLDVVLLDRALSSSAWATAVDETRTALLPDDGPARGDLILFDTLAVHVSAPAITTTFLDSLSRAPHSASPGKASYGEALRAVHAVTQTRTDIDSVRVTMITQPRWGAGSDAFFAFRAALWPGSIRLIAIDDDARSDTIAGQEQPTRKATVLASEGAGAFASAALAAGGWELTDPGEPTDADLHLVLAPLQRDTERTLLERVRRGGIVVVAGVQLPGPLGSALPWEPSPIPEGAETLGIVLEDGTVLTGAVDRIAGDPRSSAQVVAVWEDGRPAAVRRSEGLGCLVFLASPLEGGLLPFSEAYPHLLSALTAACVESESAQEYHPLDRGALQVLQSEGLPDAIYAADLRSVLTGLRLERWFIAAALALALLETAVVYRGRAA